MERAEKIGLGVAAGGHIVLFGVLSLSLLSQPDEAYKPKSIEVMIADEVGLESASPNPALVPPATSVAPELGDPDPTDLSKPEPMELTSAPDVKPTPQRQKPATKPKPKPKDKPKPKPKGSRLGKDFLKGVTDQSSVSRNQNVTGEKASASAVASLQQELYRQLKRQWKPPTGADAEKLRTKVTARLDRNGNIVGTPSATTTGITASNRSQADIHKERAIAAVRLAAPYTTFPEKYYSEWQVIEPVLYQGI
ncbi:cell envelope biogenesis protein TolA [Parasphingorhabdus cellanae]|uniref:Cell envelope biogenesis protein TolA n=1 Tax=Parasphingorhabdus cellanae TaxID=2806553 RepID=A0ABX7T605_9SPHN|nr:cell envelope biogenesis protein TolA [Parasphingorhabdus cellanae]QTD57036.1 cell envelope biogenesis protein TolA [Parasphingorhabdus cellanae]